MVKILTFVEDRAMSACGEMSKIDWYSPLTGEKKYKNKGRLRRQCCPQTASIAKNLLPHVQTSLHAFIMFFHFEELSEKTCRHLSFKRNACVNPNNETILKVRWL